MMKKAMGVFAFLALCSTASFAADAATKGKPLPAINAIDENGAQVSLNQFTGKAGVIVFFFPKAFTGGCVCENNGFRDYLSAYTQKGYVVLGASRDDPKILRIYKEKYNLNYPLLSDPTDALATSLGLRGGKRDTIVIDKNGIVTHQYNDVNAPTHHKTLINEIN